MKKANTQLFFVNKANVGKGEVSVVIQHPNSNKDRNEDPKGLFENISIKIHRISFQYRSGDITTGALKCCDISIDKKDNVIKKVQIIPPEWEDGKQLQNKVVYCSDGIKYIHIYFSFKKKSETLKTNDIDKITANLKFNITANIGDNKLLQSVESADHVPIYEETLHNNILIAKIEVNNIFHGNSFPSKIYSCKTNFELTCTLGNSPCKFYKKGMFSQNKDKLSIEFIFYFLPFLPRNDVFKGFDDDLATIIPIPLLDFLATDLSDDINTYDPKNLENSTYQEDCKRYNIDKNDRDKIIKYAMGYITEKIYMSDRIDYLSGNNMFEMFNPLLFFYLILVGPHFTIECTSYAGLLAYCFNLLNIDHIQFGVISDISFKSDSERGKLYYKLDRILATETIDDDVIKKTVDILKLEDNEFRCFFPDNLTFSQKRENILQRLNILLEKYNSGISDGDLDDDLSYELNDELQDIQDVIRSLISRINNNIYINHGMEVGGDFGYHYIVRSSLDGTNYLYYDACAQYGSISDPDRRTLANLPIGSVTQASSYLNLFLSSDCDTQFSSRTIATKYYQFTTYPLVEDSDNDENIARKLQLYYYCHCKSNSGEKYLQFYEDYFSVANSGYNKSIALMEVSNFIPKKAKKVKKPNK